jgi:sulfur-carrier protein
VTARVVLSGGFSRRYTGGVREFDIEAKNLRGVIRALDQLYPGLGAHLEEETTVAIDGEIHEVGYLQPLRQESEVFFIPKLEGG